jgi:putative transcriptional regulator
MKTSIAEVRKVMGLTQADLAEMVDVTRQTINALEAGRFNPSLQLAYKIKKALNTEHVEDLFEMEDG